MFVSTKSLSVMKFIPRRRLAAERQTCHQHRQGAPPGVIVLFSSLDEAPQFIAQQATDGCGPFSRDDTEFADQLLIQRNRQILLHGD